MKPILKEGATGNIDTCPITSSCVDCGGMPECRKKALEVKCQPIKDIAKEILDREVELFDDSRDNNQ